MSIEEEQVHNPLKRFNPKKSLKRAALEKSQQPQWELKVNEKLYSWTSKMERIDLIREGLPYGAIESVSKRTDLPINKILETLDISQKFYITKKKNDLLSSAKSELLLILVELLDYGSKVFNNEQDKFLRWLEKPNTSLGNNSPYGLFDSTTGMQEVKQSLNRIEYGNLA